MALSKDAQQLYPKLASAPGIDAFWLVGGTALALQIAHRLSEDFDFAATERRLPRKKIEGILDHLSRQGVSITPVENLELEQELEDSGLDPLDAQQDFLADNVKLTFFVVDAPALPDQATPVWRHGLRLAPPSSLFTMKRR